MGSLPQQKKNRRRFSDSKLEFFGLHVGFQRGQRGNLLKHPKLSTSWVFGQSVSENWLNQWLFGAS